MGVWMCRSWIWWRRRTFCCVTDSSWHVMLSSCSVSLWHRRAVLNTALSLSVTRTWLIISYTPSARTTTTTTTSSSSSSRTHMTVTTVDDDNALINKKSQSDLGRGRNTTNSPLVTHLPLILPLPVDRSPNPILDPSDLPSQTTSISDWPFCHNALDRQPDIIDRQIVGGNVRWL